MVETEMVRRGHKREEKAIRSEKSGKKVEEYTQSTGVLLLMRCSGCRGLGASSLRGAASR